MRRVTRIAPLLAALAAVTGPSDAWAQDCEEPIGVATCVDVDNLWARPGASPFLTIGVGDSTPAGQVTFGGVVSYQSRPLRLEAPGPGVEPREIFVVDNALDVTMLFGLGVTDALELTLAAPVTFYQDGAGAGVLTGDDRPLPRSVVRDARFGLAYALVGRPRRRGAEGLELRGRFEMVVPVGEGTSFAGARTAGIVPALAADYRVGPLELAAELSGRLRGAVPLGALDWGPQIGVAAGARVVILEDLDLAAGAEAMALASVADREEGAAPLVPTEWMHTVRIAPLLGGDLAFLVAGGGPIPLTDQAATAPRFRFSGAIIYAPRGLDSDSDRVLDRDDLCLDTGEDRDGFEDGDGCPEADNDGDGILDVRDRCRDALEDFDGFQDGDGCPDPDDDGDDILDGDDACRNQAEDFDGLEDQDGCPEPDNDGDLILDTRDLCPDAAEDRDGVRDHDGCPDPDDDADGIGDAQDKCKSAMEDKDGFEDTDGCPEPDNDADGVLDTLDECPTEPETLDGKDDDDGCAEPSATSLVSIVAGRIAFAGPPPRFQPGSARPTPALDLGLRLAARLLLARPPGDIVVVEAYGDRPGDASDAAETLAVARATAAREALVAAGVDARRVTAASGDLSAKRSRDASQLDIWAHSPSPARGPIDAGADAPDAPGPTTKETR